MPNPDLTKSLQVQHAQRKLAKRMTFDQMKSKSRAEKEFTTEALGEPASMLYRAIGATEYDKLLTRFPPNKEQLAEGAAFNSNTFAPALLARVCAEPSLDEQQWTEIWNSPDWNRGEVSELFWNAVELCNKGLDLSPIAAG